MLLSNPNSLFAQLYKEAGKKKSNWHIFVHIMHFCEIIEKDYYIITYYNSIFWIMQSDSQLNRQLFSSNNIETQIDKDRIILYKFIDASG